MFPGAYIVYRAMYLVGFALMMVVNLKTYKKFSLKKNVTVVFTLITYIAGIAGATIIGKIHSAILNYHNLPGSGGVAIMGAVIFTPIFMIAIALFKKQNWRAIIDLLAPGIFIILTCAKFGCFLNGCCHGIECSFGVMSPRIDKIVFPIQLVEVILMILIVCFCFWYTFKSKFYVLGTTYPATTILYCSHRFFIEFFRYYELEAQRHVVFGMTVWQFFCLLSILVSIIWIIVLNSKKVKLYYERKALAEVEAKALRMKKKSNPQKRKKK